MTTPPTPNTPTWNIQNADARAALDSMHAESVDAIVTSPPYWGLRDYVDGQLGLEETPAEYVDGLVAVFDAARRVLRASGSLWLVLGDSYSHDGGGGTTGGKHAAGVHGPTGTGRRHTRSGLKAKDLVGIPWQVAFALRDAGWWLREDVIWSKPNPMPESVRDRCTRAHEYVFHLTKSARYYHDAGAISESAGPVRVAGSNNGLDHPRTPDPRKKQGALGKNTYTGFNARWRDRSGERRNKRSVWTVATRPYPEAHFATYPPELIEPMILASTPPGGHVLDPFCGSGTTGLVALRHGRSFTGVELNAEYVELARARIIGDAPLLNAAAEVRP